MAKKPRRVAIMLDLTWPYKRHADVFAGTQRYANEHGWISIIDEFAYDTLAVCDHKAVPYDGVIARANRPLLKQAQRLRLPVVNVWVSSPAQSLLPFLKLGFQPNIESARRKPRRHPVQPQFAHPTKHG